MRLTGLSIIQMVGTVLDGGLNENLVNAVQIFRSEDLTFRGIRQYRNFLIKRCYICDTPL